MKLLKAQRLPEDSETDDIFVREAVSRRDARRIVEFFLSEDSFDDRNFTEGEIIQLKSLPFECLKDRSFWFWIAENKAQDIVGVICIRENNQKSGGYFIDYFVVHKSFRRQGIASMLLDLSIKQVRMVKGRYIHVDTCDTESYSEVRKLFRKKGFIEAGRIQDYYFEGEGLITYYLKVQ